MDYKADKGNHCPESSGRTEKNLRAINRAPEIVADLYRDGLINQVDAAVVLRCTRFVFSWCH